MKLLTKETFGPIIPVMPFGTETEGIGLANGTIFGLSGAVFAENNAEALRLGRGLSASTTAP